MKRKIVIIVDHHDGKTSFKGMVFQDGVLTDKITYEKLSGSAGSDTTNHASAFLSGIFKSKKP